MRGNEVSTVPIPGSTNSPDAVAVIAVAMGQWALASAPGKIRTLLGSCVGVVLYDRTAKLGGVAHIVLPYARGALDHPGKYADTAIPALIADFNRRLGGKAKARLNAKLVGGASMFQLEAAVRDNAGLNIGQRNQEVIEQILAELTIPVIGRDVGGTAGRRLTLDTTSGIVTIRVPGGSDYEI
jgi:chemotaxis protein CheD